MFLNHSGNKMTELLLDLHNIMRSSAAILFLFIFLQGVCAPKVFGQLNKVKTKTPVQVPIDSENPESPAGEESGKEESKEAASELDIFHQYIGHSVFIVSELNKAMLTFYNLKLFSGFTGTQTPPPEA